MGVLAFLGVIVPWLFRPPERMGRSEKAIWTSVLFVLVFLEVRTLYLDRDQHDREQAQARCEQIERFGQIADGIKQSIDQSQKQYEGTISHVDGVLSTTQNVAALAKKNLESITGGSSFAYVIPFTGIPPSSFPRVRDPLLTFMIVNQGPDILTGVSVTIAKIVKQYPHGAITSGEVAPVLVGNLGPHASQPVPDTYIHERGLSADSRMNHYECFITAQNGTIREEIYLRLAKSGIGWAYQIEVEKNTGKHQILKKIDWREPHQLTE